MRKLGELVIYRYAPKAWDDLILSVLKEKEGRRISIAGPTPCLDPAGAPCARLPWTSWGSGMERTGGQDKHTLPCQSPKQDGLTNLQSSVSGFHSLWWKKKLCKTLGTFGSSFFRFARVLTLCVLILTSWKSILPPTHFLYEKKDINDPSSNRMILWGHIYNTAESPESDTSLCSATAVEMEISSHYHIRQNGGMSNCTT